MDTHILQEIINFITHEKSFFKEKNQYNTSKQVLSKFVLENNIDIITYNFLHNNLIENDKNCSFNANILTKCRIYPTGITANYSVLLFVLWGDIKYLDNIEVAYLDTMARDHFKNHVRLLLCLKIENNNWTLFKNCILISSKTKLINEEYTKFYKTLSSTIHDKNFVEKYDIQDVKFKTKTTKDTQEKLEDKFNRIEKRIF